MRRKASKLLRDVAQLFGLSDKLLGLGGAFIQPRLSPTRVCFQPSKRTKGPHRMLYSHGIYILASDTQYDQLMALINSIEANVSAQLPICIIPESDAMERIEQEVALRDNLILFEDQASLQRWESFSIDIWQSLPVVNRVSQRYARHFEQREQFRKFCAFDGPFEKFVFYDVASLAMQALDDCWARLEDYDFLVDDWNHCKPSSVSSFDRVVFDSDRRAALGLTTLSGRVHGSSWFASKRGAINEDSLALLRDRLINQGEARWLNALNWWSDDELFCYMTLRCREQGLGRLFNYTLSARLQERTGNCAMGDSFVAVGPMLYSAAHSPEPESLKPIHRVEFRQYSSFDFVLLCEGHTVAIPHDYIFLHYRYLHCQKKQRSQQIRLARRPFQGEVKLAQGQIRQTLPNRRRRLVSTQVASR